MQNQPTDELVPLSREVTIRVHEPFAAMLAGSSEEVDFDVSLFDCYRFSGHACQAITGAFLSTKAAVKNLFPGNEVAVRGDFEVEFGSEIQEMASGPRANVIGFVTGVWSENGFPGLKGQQVRKNRVTFGHGDLAKNAIRFSRLSTGKTVEISYHPGRIIEGLNHGLQFPQSWRAEVIHILKHQDEVITCSQTPLARL